MHRQFQPRKSSNGLATDFITLIGWDGKMVQAPQAMIDIIQTKLKELQTIQTIPENTFLEQIYKKCLNDQIKLTKEATQYFEDTDWLSRTGQIVSLTRTIIIRSLHQDNNNKLEVIPLKPLKILKHSDEEKEHHPEFVVSQHAPRHGKLSN